MISSYIFNSEGLATLARYVTPDTLFAFELDEALALLIDGHPLVPEPIRMTLERLTNLARVAVITWRPRKEAQSILGFEPHLFVGKHGAEWSPERKARNWKAVVNCLKWREQLYDMLSHLQGVEIEFKGETVTIHYRNALEPEEAFSVITTAVKKLEPTPQIEGEKFIVNLVTKGLVAKGPALLAAMAQSGAQRAIYFGTNETDGKVFSLERADVFGVHVGIASQSAAPYYLKNKSELLGLLSSMVGILESHL